MSVSRIAVVTGGNRGIGLEVYRQLAQRGFAVMLGYRDLAKGEQTAAQLEVTDDESITRLRRYLDKEYGHLNVLIKNAAILYHTWWGCFHC